MVSSSKMCAEARRRSQLTAPMAEASTVCQRLSSASAALLAAERVALRLEGSECVRHLGPYRLHGQGDINGDEYSPGMACEV
jgi:hypothetical protein